MKKNFKKIKQKIPAKLAPILVIVVCLLILVGGVNYIYAAITSQTAPSLPTSLSWSGGTAPINRGVTPGHVLTADMWNALVNHIASSGGGGGGGSVTCDFVNSTQVIGQVYGAPVACGGDCCGTGYWDCEGGQGCRRTPYTNVSGTSDASGNLVSITRTAVAGSCVCTGTCVNNSP